MTRPRVAKSRVTRSLIGAVLALNVAVSGVVLQAARPAGAASGGVLLQAGVPQSSVTGGAVVALAERYLGYPYTTVGNSPGTGFSCIGFVSYVYQTLGINLPDDLGGAMGFSPTIPFSSIQPGDVLYFQNTVWPGLSHAAIYIGGGRIVHAEWYNRGVVISSLSGDSVDGDYWTQHYLGANRPWAAAPAVPQPPARPAAAPAPRRAPVIAVRRPALPAGPRATVRVAELNVRSAPSLAGRIVTAISQGTRLTVLGHYGSWYHVALRGGVAGWTVSAGIHGARLSGARASAVTARPASRTVRRSAAYTALGSVVADVSGLRLHAAPSLGARVIGSVGANQRLRLIGTRGQWTHVLLPRGAAAWVSSAYVRSAGSRRAASGSSAAASKRVSGTVNVRVQPSMASPLAGLLTPGRSFVVFGSWNGWTYVRVSSGVAGWVSSALLPRSGGSRRAPPASARGGASGTTALTATVRVHAAPSVGSRAVAVAYMGTAVTVLATGATWTKVRLPSGRAGYVLRAYVQ